LTFPVCAGRRPLRRGCCPNCGSSSQGRIVLPWSSAAQHGRRMSNRWMWSLRLGLAGTWPAAT